MRLTDRVDALARRDETNDGGKDYLCTPCGVQQKGNWHHCPNCHLTFPQMAGFDRHRTGKFENRATGQANARRCMTADELAAGGWQQDQAHAHAWRLPAREDD